MRHATSADAETWSDWVDVFAEGVSGTADDAALAAYSVAVYQGVIYLLHGGNSGSATTPRLVVGESPEKLTKVPWVDPTTFAASDVLVSYAADLSFTMPDYARHVDERMGPGSLIDAPFEPMDLSFTMRHTAQFSDATDAYGLLADTAAGPQVGQDATTGAGRAEVELNQVHICYMLEDDDGNPAEYYLFPHCGVSQLNIAEGAEGNTITATLRCHNMRRPLFGSIE